MDKYFPFNKKQKDYIEKSSKFWISIAEGGKRAGKNILNIIAFGKNIDLHKDRYHLAAGVTTAASKMNIIDSNGFGLLNYFQDRAKVSNHNGKQALIIDDGKKIIIIEGGQKISDAARIKGMSFGSAYITEANEVHKNFFLNR
jgi:hypothetical protein